MRAFGLCLCCFAIALAVEAQDQKTKTAENALLAYDSLPEEWQEKAIAAWKDRHAELKKQMADIETKKYPKDVKGKEIKQRRDSERAESKKHLDWLLANERPYYPPLRPPYKKGQWGSPDSITVKQIIGKDRALCIVFIAGDVVVEGLDLEGVVDGDDIALKSPFVIVETETLKLANGATKTVHVMRQVKAKDNRLESDKEKQSK